MSLFWTSEQSEPVNVFLVTENQESWLTAAAEVTSSNGRGFNVLQRQQSCKKHNVVFTLG